MENKSLGLLSEEELEYHKRFMSCTTIEELQKMADDTNHINENVDSIQYRTIDIPLEEFKNKYDLIDIKDLKGKYGF